MCDRVLDSAGMILGVGLNVVFTFINPVVDVVLPRLNLFPNLLGD